MNQIECFEIPNMIDWKKTAKKNIRKLSAFEALETLRKIQREGATINHLGIKNITGGFNSQAINFLVIRMLAKKTGILLKG